MRVLTLGSASRRQAQRMSRAAAAASARHVPPRRRPPATHLRPSHPSSHPSSAGSCHSARRSSHLARASGGSGPTTVAAAAAHAWWTATGVPLIELLQTMTIEQAALRCLALVVATAVGVALGNKLLDVVGTQMEAVAERTKNASGLKLLLGTALASVHRPAKMLLPVYGGFYTLLVLTAFADVAVTRADDHIHSLAHVCGHQILAVLKGLAQLMQDTSELVLIVFIAWFLIAWKDELINIITSNLEVDEADETQLPRVLVPLGNVLSWGIVIAATLTTLTAFGINVQPLLAVGSLGTVAVGFAAQSTMQNVVSALQIYTTRPFIVGDRVQLKSLSGTTIAAGVVESIAPMRTVLRADNKLPIYIGNKDVMALIIVNESKLRRNNVAPKLPLIEATITLRYCDVDRVPQVERAIEAFLRDHPDVDNAISPRCVLVEFSSKGPELGFRALLAKSAATKQAYIRGQLLREAERIVRENGAYLAIAEGFGEKLPPSPPPALSTSVDSGRGSSASVSTSGDFGPPAAA